MTRVLIIVAAILSVCLTPAYSQTPDLRLPVIVDAESTNYDGRTSMTMFTGLRLTQGNIGIVADLAQTNRMDFDDSVWQFSGNVAFDIEEGHVTCDSADLRFSEFQLKVATITGSPATFEFQRLESDQTTYAEAERLYYDVVAGTIEFSGGATITEGGNVISSETLVYNFREQRISASGNGNERVTVTYTPPESDASGNSDEGGDVSEPAMDEAAPEAEDEAAEDDADTRTEAAEPPAEGEDSDPAASVDGSE